MMKSKMTENYKKAVRYAARKIAARDANTACVFLAFQPKLPKKVENLRKNKEWQCGN